MVRPANQSSRSIPNMTWYSTMYKGGGLFLLMKTEKVQLHLSLSETHKPILVDFAPPFSPPDESGPPFVPSPSTTFFDLTAQTLKKRKSNRKAKKTDRKKKAQNISVIVRAIIVQYKFFYFKQIGTLRSKLIIYFGFSTFLQFDV